MMRATVIVNNYNYERFVGKAIESALDQEYSPTQVVVVDDGSTDDSWQVIQSYGDRIVQVFKSNGGQASAFNAGFEAATGDVVFMLDADDVLLRHAVRRAVEVASKTPDLAKLTWRMPEIDAQGRSLGTKQPRHELDEGDCRAALIQRGPLYIRAAPTSGNAFTRVVLERLLPMPEAEFTRGADGYLLLLAPLHGRIVCLEEPLSCYRRHGASGLLSKSEFDKARVMIERYHRYSQILKQHLQAEGIAFDPTGWQPRHQWIWRLEAMGRAIEKHVAPSQGFILVDEDMVNAGVNYRGRRRFHLIGREGQYHGPPADSQAALAAIHDAIAAGATHLIMLAECEWWLEHYTDLADWLTRHAVEVRDDGSIRIWRLPDAPVSDSVQRA